MAISESQMDLRPLVRITTAGSVDDGKSTLIGRLLYETDSLKEDQLSALIEASRATGEEGLNLALLTDGLTDERSQKITIDVAYRHFATSKRRYLLADSPGHAQYTRNMFTGVSRADAAIILTDASRGLTEQSHRHLLLASLLKVPHVIVAVNKMDAVAWQEEAYLSIAASIEAFTKKLVIPHLSLIPISALTGENVTIATNQMPWFKGSSLLDSIENLVLDTRKDSHEFRFPVQTVVRPNSALRGFLGRPVSGSIRVGEEVIVLPTGTQTKIKSLLTPDGEIDRLETRQSGMILLEDEVDAARGAMLARPGSPPKVSKEVQAMVCWMGEPWQADKTRLRMLIGTQDVPAKITELRYLLDPVELHRKQAESLSMNDIARVSIKLSDPIAADTFEHNRATGSFILVDQDSCETAAAGMILELESAANSLQKSQGLIVWLTGMSGAGKSTLADKASATLRQEGRQVVRLDGDALRAGVCSDLGFSMEDREENNRRAGEIAKLLADQGFIVLASFISPLASHRAMLRAMAPDRFIEVHVDCPTEVLKERDVKGLYAKAASGGLKEMTGVSSPYEAPENPDLYIDTSTASESESLTRLLGAIENLL